VRTATAAEREEDLRVEGMNDRATGGQAVDDDSDQREPCREIPNPNGETQREDCQCESGNAVCLFERGGGHSGRSRGTGKSSDFAGEKGTQGDDDQRQYRE